MLAANLQSLNDLISNELLLLKSRSDPLVFFGGDLNRKSIEDALADFNDIKQVNFDPARGQTCLDLIYSNAQTISSSVWPPLETPLGVKSDHNCVLFQTTVPCTRQFVWISKMGRSCSLRTGTESAHRGLHRMTW